MRWMLVWAAVAVLWSGGAAGQPAWPESQSSAFATNMSFASGETLSGKVALFYDYLQDALRQDVASDSSQLQKSLLALFGARLVYVFSPNSSLCSVFCLSGPSISLPLLRVAPNDTRGSTWRLSPSSWLRQTHVANSAHGLFNASVITQLDESGAPKIVTANFTLDDVFLAQHTCTMKQFESPSRIDPAVFLPPVECRSLKPTNCYAPFENDPFPVAQGCYFAESLAPFGTPPDESCTCS